MSDSLSKRAFRALQEDGVRKFPQKVIRFTYQQCGDTVFAVDNNELKKLSVRETRVEQSDSVVITYNGRSEARLPVLLSRLQKEIVTPKRYILEFRDAKLFGQPLFVNLGWKCFYPTSVGNSRSKFTPSKHPLRDLVPPKPAASKRIETGFIIGGNRSGFAHWFYEQLPKLHWFDKYCGITNEEPKLIVSGELANWQTRSLELIGYSPDNYVHHKPSHVIDVDRLLVPPHPQRTRGGEFQVCPSAIQWIKSRILSNIPSDSTNFQDRIYVSRADANRRQVANENEVVSLLDEYGFKSFEPGRLSFDDQVRLFANADLIVGPHGAGLTNMIYGGNMKVLELMTEESGEHFFVLANECNHTYEFLQCEPIDNNGPHTRYSDMIVNVCNLENKLNSLINFH